MERELGTVEGIVFDWWESFIKEQCVEYLYMPSSILGTKDMRTNKVVVLNK